MRCSNERKLNRMRFETFKVHYEKAQETDVAVLQVHLFGMRACPNMTIKALHRTERVLFEAKSAHFESCFHELTSIPA